jgi:hypothetical protein
MHCQNKQKILNKMTVNYFTCYYIDADDERLDRWLNRSKNSVEKAKKKLDLYYTLRTTVPELMTCWDTNADWIKTATETV